MKKITALILAGIMIFALCACGGNTGSSNDKATNDPLTKDDVITMTILSHSSWPYREDWKAWDYIREGTGATIEVNAIPSTDYGSKVPLMFADPENSLTDLITFDYKPEADKWVDQGGVIAYDDMAEYMPNYNAWIKTLNEDEYRNVITSRKSYDGKIYYTPATGREIQYGLRTWLYRKDIFEKHNIAVPTTFDEVYEACKALKELYPESYPFCIRSGFQSLDVTGPSWKPYWNTGIYYNFDEDKWYYGAAEDITVDILELYAKMVDEKLMPSDFMTMNGSAWEELVTTDRAFIFPEFQTRIDYFHSLTRKNKPEFDLQVMAAPVAAPTTGAAMINKKNYDPVGFVLTNTRNEKRIANAAKFIDWFYSDEAYELLSWGKEGETYEIIDGKRKFIKETDSQDVTSLYGFKSYGTYTRQNPEAVKADLSSDTVETAELVLEHTLPNENPTRWLSFNVEEQHVKEELGAAISNYTNEMLTKFILRQEPISNFDNFVETLEEMGVNDLLAAYESAYNRVK